MISLCALLVLYFPAIAQLDSTPPIIKRLMQEKGNVLVFSPYMSRPLEINDLPSNFKQSGQVLTKTKKGLFLNQLGTGRIYQLEQEKNQYRWNRIDSTFYTGYNFGSLFLSWDII